MSPEALRLLGDRMDALDDELIQAEKAGDLSRRIATLREKAQVWREYGELVRSSGGDPLGAELAARRDLTTARQLQAGAL